MERITFEEHFKDNSNNWWTYKDDNGSCDIIDGCYVIEHFRENNDFSTWRTIPLIESKAFSFEASFKFINGYQKSGFGFLWGQKSNEGTGNGYSGFHYFVISASGWFVIRSYSQQTKKTETVKDWNDLSQIIKAGENSTNVLKIMKFDDSIDNQLYFLVNNHIVFQTKYLPFFGYETGFIAFQNMKIAIDYFKATYYINETLINN